MKILLVSQYYWPESFGAGVWIAELAEWLHARGHHVTVITGFPNHPDGVIFPEYRGRILQREERNGVRIIRTWLYATPRTRKLWQRVLSQGSFSLSLLLGILFAPRADVVWYASPPLPGSVTAWWLSWIHGASYTINISDLEPERSVALGLFKNPLLIRGLQAIERFAYRHADRICVLSPGTKDWLSKKEVAASKICVTPNWANGEVIQPLPPSMSLRVELGITNECVVLYSGNMGYTMGDLESVVDAARLLAGEKDIRFLLAGEGVRRNEIEKRAEGLPNITFLPIQPRDRYPRLLATADVCLVVLCREGTQASVPSKTYSIMAAGRPVLAICESENDTARVVRGADCGQHISPGDVNGLAEAIRRYRDDRTVAVAQGRRARSHFEKHYIPEVGMAAYEKLFAEFGAGGPKRNLIPALESAMDAQLAKAPSFGTAKRPASNPTAVWIRRGQQVSPPRARPESHTPAQ